MCDPSQMCDLLGYSSTIVKVSLDFEVKPWLEYDVHNGEGTKLGDNTSLWTALRYSNTKVCTWKAIWGENIPDTRNGIAHAGSTSIHHGCAFNKLQVSPLLFPISEDFTHSYGVPPTESQPLPYPPRPTTSGHQLSSEALR